MVKSVLLCGFGCAVAAWCATFEVSEGTKIPLTMINSVSSKQAVEGDRVYMETAFPVLENGKVIIPVGSYVAGTVTKVKRPGRARGKAEMFIRFDSLTLPNGVTRDFRARVGGLDGQTNDKLDRQEGTIRGDSNKGGDARTVGEAAGVGTSVGAITGSVAGHTGMGVGIGAAAGAAAGLVAVLASRGPEIILARGSSLDMVLDRKLSFEEADLDFSGPGIGSGGGQLRRIQPVQPAASTQRQGIPLPGRGIPGSRQQ